jgi:hypothetical protein
MADDEVKPDAAQRLVKARSSRGFKSAKEAALRFGWNYDTYSQHERGERGLVRAAQKYARAFGVSEGWLLTGEGRVDIGVGVVGYVGAGGEAFFEPIEGGDLLDADAPPGTVAVKIRGTSLGHGFDGWYALYIDRHDPPTDILVGRLCIVGTRDGRTLIKWVRRSAIRGTFNLQAGTGEVEENVPLDWAAAVIDLRPH